LRLEEVDIGEILVGEGLWGRLDEGSLRELASSITRHGVLQPLIVEPLEGGRYGLLVGRRRLEAARIAGLRRVPALVLDKALGPEESMTVRLVEVLHREGLDPIDEAEAYAALRGMGVSVSEIARRVGKERTYVSHQMRPLRLKPEQQLSLAEEILEKGLTLAETRERVKEILGKPLKWRLVPIRIEVEAYDRLKRIAPDGDVAKLLKQAVENLLSNANL